MLYKLVLKKHQDTGDILDLPNTICNFPAFYDHVIKREDFDKNGGKFFNGAFAYHVCS